ncbi:hypothetical protein MLD38_011139 [Melastoma candidum]|uniref:Uncharacterized protein n=1 Tax=Melastoma candidum TaxID=119954 RepID=A0ACB9R3E9_9MYRT|nr:hypothetical protein MLD38_011139 [Melastoma candidum]
MDVDNLAKNASVVDYIIPAKTMMKLIKEAVNSELEGKSSSASAYYKPYSRIIEGLKMPVGYQPRYFQQFDGKGINGNKWLISWKLAIMQAQMRIRWLINLFTP